jgi:hypothetical protein
MFSEGLASNRGAPMTEFVSVKHQDAPEGAPAGKVPVRALEHWKSKGYVVVDEKQAAAAIAADPALAETPETPEAPAPAPGADAGTAPQGEKASIDGTAAGSADDTQKGRRTPSGDR